MTKNNSISKLLPTILLVSLLLFFTLSFLRGSFLVQKSEKELNPKKQTEEAQAGKYSLKEIDATTGQIRWELTANEATTQNNLQNALIKDIKAKVYKNNEVIFELYAPKAKGNSLTKEIYLLGEVTAKDKSGNFLLKSNRLVLGMGTSIEAQKGFNLYLKNNGTVIGDSVLINDDQTKIIVTNLKEASFKDIIFSGAKVLIQRDKNGNLTNAIVSNSGKVILKNLKNNTLSANTIKWNQTGDVEAISNVIYISEDKTFQGGHLLIKADGKVFANDNVKIIHGKTKCYGNSLSYENNSLIILSGKPKAVQADKEITADKIVYDINTGKVEAIGNVRTIVTQKDNRTSGAKT